MGRGAVTRVALLDTSALIGAVDSETVEALPYDRLLISALTYAELRLGLVTAADTSSLRHRVRRIDEISRAFGAGVPFDDACAREYERIVQAAVERGQRPRANTVDRMIAATAAAHHLPLVTRNAADVRGLGEILEIVSL